MNTHKKHMYFTSGIRTYTYITNGIRKLKKPESVTVFLPNGKKPLLAVIENGNPTLLPISRKVAEVLISEGYSYGD